ncbi:inorganic phosphate transporter [Salinarchaeum laminariae]|uniref:inorganic phosphate transporter n=1 Tax=Salinarchaeum laminariae TaxID=869888 RepID=UPI0020BE12A5|nr:inorganic phosphate transporter [Salinarchaeum laminariae]
MVALSAVAMLLVAFVGSLFMAWTIGAGSSGSTPFAPAVGANAISIMRAGFVVGLLGLAGAILQGANVSRTVGSGLIQGATLSPMTVVIGLFTAALLVTVGIFTGYPIATAFTVTGAVTGVGVALGGVPAWGTYQQTVALWLVIPFVGSGVAYGMARVLADDRVPTGYTIGVLGVLITAVVVNMPFTILGPSGQSRSISATFNSLLPAIVGISRTVITLLFAGIVGAVLWRRHERSSVNTERHFLLALGCLVAFSAGATQVGLAVGPLLPLLEEWSIPMTAVLAIGGLGLLAGSWTGAPRMIKALSQDYSALGPKRSIAALVPSFLIAQTAVFLGAPVSFNEIIVSAIIGSGYAAESAPVSISKIRNTSVAWVTSLSLSGLCSYALVSVLLIVQ